MGDWRVKYDGVCSRCGVALRAGEIAVYDRATRTVHCVSCPTAPDPSRPRSTSTSRAGPPVRSTSGAPRSGRWRSGDAGGTALCFIDGDWPLISPPDVFRCVRLEGPRSLRKRLAGEALDEAAVARPARVLAAALPPR